jgi:signal transduction histidine kinase
MRLGTKLALIIAAASVIPIGAATLVGRELVQRGSRAEYDRLLRDGQAEVMAQVLAMQEEVVKAVERLADPEDQFIGPLLIAVANGGPDDETFRQLASAAPRVMRERGLQILSVFGVEGRILASGHFPGRMGDSDPRFAGAEPAGRPSEPSLVPERILLEGRPSTLLTVQARRVARSPLGSRVAVVGGRVFGPELLHRLRLRGGTEVLIEDAAGTSLAGPVDWKRYAAYPRQTLRFTDRLGQEAARAILAVPDDGLRATLRAINAAAGALSGSALLLSLLLGVIAGRRVGRRLQRLAVGAGAVAAGDLEQRLTVGSRDEVGELVETFNQMTADLKESKQRLLSAERVAAWQEIARRIAHEIKNPLFPIQTSIETLRKVYLKKHPDFEEIFNESTTTILEEVSRLKNIVTEFSNFARLPKPKLAPCDLRELVPQVVSLYGSNEVPIDTHLPAELPAVLADRDQLTQVLVNLIKNARESLAGRPSPLVQIHVEDQGPSVEIRVQDNGLGFNEEARAQIFHPYFTTKGATGGTGLGLAIVHRIITEHGGRIEARSAPGSGATFAFTLPRAAG